MTAADVMRKLLAEDDILAVPGVYNPVVATLAASKGFKALYFSGGGFANSLSLPDLGVTTLSEVSEAVAQITRVVDLPVIVDVDTGFGETLNVRRTVAEMERAGAAAIHIEDQVNPKKCGHLEGKALIEPDEMVKKVVAAVESRRGNLMVIARTDARSVEGLDAAVDRARLYLKAGADMIFPEALETREEFKEFAYKVKSPLLANMTEFGKSPYISVEEFKKMGYRVVIFPITALRASLKAVSDVFEAILNTGTQSGVLDRLMTRQQVYDLIRYYDYEKWDRTVSGKGDEILRRRRRGL